MGEVMWVREELGEVGGYVSFELFGVKRFSISEQNDLMVQSVEVFRESTVSMWECGHIEAEHISQEQTSLSLQPRNSYLYSSERPSAAKPSLAPPPAAKKPGGGSRYLSPSEHPTTKMPAAALTPPNGRTKRDAGCLSYQIFAPSLCW